MPSPSLGRAPITQAITGLIISVGSPVIFNHFHPTELPLHIVTLAPFHNVRIWQDPVLG